MLKWATYSWETEPLLFGECVTSMWVKKSSVSGKSYSTCKWLKLPVYSSHKTPQIVQLNPIIAVMNFHMRKKAYPLSSGFSYDKENQVYPSKRLPPMKKGRGYLVLL